MGVVKKILCMTLSLVVLFIFILLCVVGCGSNTEKIVPYGDPSAILTDPDGNMIKELSVETTYTISGDKHQYNRSYVANFQTSYDGIGVEHTIDWRDIGITDSCLNSFTIKWTTDSLLEKCNKVELGIQKSSTKTEIIHPEPDSNPFSFRLGAGDGKSFYLKTDTIIPTTGEHIIFFTSTRARWQGLFNG